ncbi:MAG: transposase, partial [Cyclobacteriaceae bacterium]|nr:transposase [Cyclobacteriaceae bacterium]
KERNIRITAKPLGRPKKVKETPYQKSKRKKENAERNHIEGKIGQAKNGYRMNQVRTKLRETAESWISCIVFVMNLIRMESDMAKKKGKSSWLYTFRLLFDTNWNGYIRQLGYRQRLIKLSAN